MTTSRSSSRWSRGVLTLLGGETYRGTPLQQHALGRAIDWLTTRGLVYRPRDPDALYRSLEARGLIVRLGAETPGSGTATARRSCRAWWQGCATC